VTEQIQAQIPAEELIRTLFATSQIGISLTTVEGKILVANEALLRMTGYSEEETLQRNVPEFYVHPEQRDELLARLAESPSVNDFGIKIKRRDGTHFYANLNVSKISREGQEIILSLIEDVTEQVQIKEQLQQEIAERETVQQELQTQISLLDGLLDAAKETVQIWDAQTLEYIKWNRTFRELTGYSDDEIAAMNPVAGFFGGADSARAEAAYERLLREGQATEVLTQITKDGSRIPLEYTGAVNYDSEGNATQVIVIARDITERLQAEEQLRFQAQLLGAVDQAVIVTDLDGHIAYWNRSAERLYGWSADEAIGRMTNELMIDNYDQQPIPEIRAHFLAGKSWSGEYPVRHRDGTLLSVETAIAPVFNATGELTHVIGVSSDITERKQAEEALQASEKAYRDLVEKISDVIYTVSLNGVITYLNPAIESLLGQPPEEVVGQPFAQFIHPDDLGRMQANVQYLLSGEAPGPAEYRLLNASGETRWVRVSSQPIVEAGRVIGLQGVLTDITERKRAEEQLEEVAAAAERNRLAAELHDSVTQGLYSASLIAESLPLVWEEDREEARRGLKHLRRFNQGALAEMRTLLLELRPTALVEQELPVLLRQLADATKAQTRTVVTTTVVGDCSVPTEIKVALYRIAQEALNNMVKHAGARQARVNLHGDGAQITLRVSDDGCGFDPEDTHFDGMGSHGMGIAIMRDRARDIDATLSITSQPDLGTEVLAEWRRNHE